MKYKIAGSTYRTTDLTHWLALDTAARALADAGFPDGDGPAQGEHRRDRRQQPDRRVHPGQPDAAALAVRPAHGRRRADASRAGTTASWRASWPTWRPRYKSAFPPIDEDTLAGGLSNTIAGRICNHFDLGGGGYTVDGACSSSLLSVATACNALADGQLDVAVAGGVDLSIDPFEIIGFAKTGALATGEMRVYDQHSNGFWPGEGCGMLVLMREDDADARGLRIYATIAGWGYSSDGKGGITRPEAAGHRLALSRAYRLAGFGIDTVGYLEGHGTGTAVGDATELRALHRARAGPPTRPAAGRDQHDQGQHRAHQGGGRASPA